MPIRYNIAITPSEEISNYSVEISKLLATKGSTYFVLNNEGFLPHISLYYAEFPEENLPKIIQQLESLSKGIKPIKASFLGFGDYRDYVGVALEKTKGVQHLQHRVIETINPLREGIVREKYQTAEYQSTLTKSQKQNILQYGYPTVGPDWDPHLTLTRFEDIELAKKLSSNLNWEIPEIRIDQLGVYTMGSNGTCTSLLKSISLEP